MSCDMNSFFTPSTSSLSNSLPSKKMRTPKAGTGDSDDNGELQDNEVSEVTDPELELRSHKNKADIEGANEEDEAVMDVENYDEAEDVDEERYDDAEENEYYVEDQRKSKPKSEGEDVFEDFEFAEPESESHSDMTEEVSGEKASTWTDGDKICTAKINMERKYVCVDYPGVIQNKEKALATLGGLTGLSKVFTENLKLELSFRPNDPYSKTTTASFSHAKNLLFKVRRKSKVLEEMASSCSSKSDNCPDVFYEYQVEVFGVVDRMYTFNKPCDFQFLPVVRQPGGQYKEILTGIRPVMSDTREEYLSRSVPLYLPPFVFSRREMPAKYFFDAETPHEGKQESHNLIGLDRKRRMHGTIHISFDHPGVPNVPDSDALENIEKLPRKHHEEGLAIFEKLFEERPMWSKVAIMSKLDASHRRYVKYLLPMVSFYFVNGPWGNLWCKFGYDPRKQPVAKKYQTLDFRIRSVANRSKVESKRGMELARLHKQTLKRKPDALTHTTEPTDPLEGPNVNASLEIEIKNLSELSFVFSPDHIPPYKQMRYQVCDVLHEEVQKRMHENDGQETACTERDGWCVPDFTDICRDIMSASVEKLFAK